MRQTFLIEYIFRSIRCLLLDHFGRGKKKPTASKLLFERPLSTTNKMAAKKTLFFHLILASCIDTGLFSAQDSSHYIDLFRYTVIMLGR